MANQIVAIETLFIVQLLLVGISHVVHPSGWIEFLCWMRDKGRAGIFLVGIIYLWAGSIIVAFHPVWTGAPMLLTILGWFLVIKAGFYFLLPDTALRTLQRVSPESEGLLRIPGVVFVALALFLASNLWASSF